MIRKTNCTKEIKVEKQSMENQDHKFWLLALVIVFLLLCNRIILSADVKDVECVEWKTSQGGNGHSYAVVHVSEGITWAQAFRKAISLGGHLATITSKEECDFIFRLVGHSKYWYQPKGWTITRLGPWIGGFQAEGAQEPNGGWHWVTGEPFAYTNWARKQEPNVSEPNAAHDCGHSGSVNRICFISRWSRKGAPFWCDASADCTHVKSFVLEIDKYRVHISTEPRNHRKTSIDKTLKEKAEKLIAFDDFDNKLHLPWNIIQADLSHLSLTKKPGALTITTQPGAIFRSCCDIRNLILMKNPIAYNKNFMITTCLSSFNPVVQSNQAGIICYNNVDNYLKIVYEYHNSHGLGFTIMGKTEGKKRIVGTVVSPLKVKKVWLRITKENNHYTLFTSFDGKKYCRHLMVMWGDGSVRQIGLIAKNGLCSKAPEVEAAFEYFEMKNLTFE